jgi:hypothetical protein
MVKKHPRIGLHKVKIDTTQLLFDEHIYSEAQVRTIIRKTRVPLPKGRIEIIRQDLLTRHYNIRVMVSRREALQVTLNNAARSFAWEFLMQTRPAASQVKKQLKTIAGAARRLSRALSKALQSEVPNQVFSLRGALYAQIFSKPNGTQTVGLPITHKEWVEFFNAIGFLGDAAMTAASKITTKKGRQGSDRRNKGEVALQKHIVYLAEVYENYWNKPAGVGRGASHIDNGVGHDADSPAIRFIREAVKTLGISQISGESIAGHLRRGASKARQFEKSHQKKSELTI